MDSLYSCSFLIKYEDGVTVKLECSLKRATLLYIHAYNHTHIHMYVCKCVCNVYAHMYVCNVCICVMFVM